MPSYTANSFNQSMSKLTPEGFRNFFTYYNGGIKQQEGIEALYEAMPASLLDESTTWIDLYRTPDPVPDSVLPKAGVDLICEFEGFVPRVYDDGLGVPTIGYGSTFYVDGRKVQWGDPAITEPEGRAMMEVIAEKDFWNVISKTIPFWKDMNDNQRGALLSFSYNLGARFYNADGFATISRVLRNKDWPAVPDALYLYRMPGTNVEAGLARRRKAEGDLWVS